MVPFLLPAIQAGAGLVQSVFGGIRAHKAQKELERMQTPTYSPSRAITDYYSKALSRYGLSPYESSMYKNQMQNIQRSTAQGLGTLQEGRAGIGGVAALIQAQNDATLKAAGAAESDQASRLSQLGQAAGLMGEEERQMFNINQMLPYQQKVNLLSQKAAGGAATANAGLQNIFGGLSAGSQLGLMKSFNQGDGDYGADYYQESDLRPSTYKVPLANV